MRKQVKATLKALGVKPNTAPVKRGPVVKAAVTKKIESWRDRLRDEKMWTNPRTPKASERANVRAIHVRTNRCTPAEMAKLTGLEYVRILAIEDAHVAPFLTVLRDMKKLVWLSVEGLAQIVPPEIGALKRLRRLELHGASYKARDVMTLPDEMFDLAGLEELVIDQCAIETLPAAIGRLKKLNYLMLWQDAKLRSLPKELGTLPSLDSIDLVRPNLLDTEHVFPILARLPKLTRLRYSDSNSTTVPAAIGRFRALTSLSVAGSIREVSPQIAKCKTLEGVDFSWNALRELTPALAKLPALRGLGLYANDDLDFEQAIDVVVACKQLTGVTLPAGDLPASVYACLTDAGYAQTGNMYGDRWIRGTARA